MKKSGNRVISCAYILGGAFGALAVGLLIDNKLGLVPSGQAENVPSHAAPKDAAAGNAKLSKAQVCAAGIVASTMGRIEPRLSEEEAILGPVEGPRNTFKIQTTVSDMVLNACSTQPAGLVLVAVSSAANCDTHGDRAKARISVASAPYHITDKSQIVEETIIIDDASFGSAIC